jgi:conjugative relaxase-like TrwC/TraI family protein
VIQNETGREPTATEEKKIKSEEARRHRAPVAGFDLVFSPVKSAALLWALDERAWVRDAIKSAHEAAITEALVLLEDHAAYTRTGPGGIAQIETNGLIAAAFEHWDSRAGDPNLHTHVAVSSKVQGTDGKWRALDARPLYAMKVAASEAYNTAFEAHLTAQLGVTFTPRPDTTTARETVREITGIPPAMIAFFSRRRAAIEARYADLVRDYRAAHGHDPGTGAAYALARQANLTTRQGKKPPRSLASKRAAWRDELRERFGPAAVAQVMQAVPRDRPAAVPAAPASPVDHQALAERTVATVATRRSTWTVWNIRAEVERQLRTEIPVLPPDQHRATADAVTKLAASPAFSIACEAPSPLNEPPQLRRLDGEPVFTRHGAERFTSQAVLDAETRLVNAARTQTATGLSGPSVAAALDGFEAVTRTSLDVGQRHLVTAFACDSRLLLAGIGPAGSGKTTGMRALQHALRHGGQRLVPLATSAAAADVLGRELGTRAENLHKFLHEWTAGRAADRLRAGASIPEDLRLFRLGPGDVVLVDEAGMAGTFPLDQLVRIASARGAVVRLLGDDRQLPAVEGGGALRLIATQPGTPYLTTLYRFRNPDEAAATLQLRTGDPAAVDWYARTGRITAGSRETMTEAAYTGWRTDMLAGKVTLMAAADTTDVTALSARARADRVAAGQVESDGVRLRDGNLAGAGDWIITRQNDRRLPLFAGRDWVKNGDAWHVVRRLDDGSLRVRHLGHRGLITLPAPYVRDHVQLLYATTAHRAQGATVDTAHPLITDGMSREALYVLATRARQRTTLYVATHDLPFDDDPRVNRARTDPRAQAAREVLLNILGTETAPISATETITTAQDQSASLVTLVPRYLHAAHQDADARYRSAAIGALGEQLGRDLTSDPAWGAVVRRMFDAEGRGWDPGRLLATAVAQRELATADSIAEVITWRLDAFLASHPEPPQPAGSTPEPARPRHDPVQAPACQPYESAAQARERLTELTLAALDPQLAERARSETAWPALIAALRRAENAGFDPVDALTRTATTRELRTARSISEVLAWRISRHIAAHLAVKTVSTAADSGATAPEGSPASAVTRAEVLLPWVPSPRLVPAKADETAPLTAYITDAATAITTRTEQLADTAIRHQPPWMSPLGDQPADPDHARQWRRHIEIIAAYRDQHAITADDPRQVLGPYAEPGHAGHNAYWHAADSVLAARQLAGLDPADNTTSTDAQARAQVAADIYDALPRTEREAIATMIAQTPGIAWLGHPSTPDEQAATRPGYAGALTATLARRGHATLTTAPVHPGWEVPAEPVEAAYARRRQPPAPRPGARRTHEPIRDQRTLLAPRLPAPDMPAHRHTR